MSKMNLRRLNWLKKKVRTKYSLGTLGRYPRLVVFKSNKHIYGQLIDDVNCKTLLSASTMDKDFKKKTDTKTWELFVSRNNKGTLFHTRRFLNYHPVGRFKDHSLMFFEKGKRCQREKGVRLTYPQFLKRGIYPT